MSINVFPPDTADAVKIKKEYKFSLRAPLLVYKALSYIAGVEQKKSVNLKVDQILISYLEDYTKKEKIAFFSLRLVFLKDFFKFLHDKVTRLDFSKFVPVELHDIIKELSIEVKKDLSINLFCVFSVDEALYESNYEKNVLSDNKFSFNSLIIPRTLAALLYAYYKVKPEEIAAGLYDCLIHIHQFFLFDLIALDHDFKSKCAKVYSRIDLQQYLVEPDTLKQKALYFLDKLLLYHLSH